MRSFEQKFIPFSKLGELSAVLHQSKKRVITTNGCFDILHLGHVKYLKEAKALGDILIVGINSDASVRKIKGSDRPINSESSRSEIIAALEAVDHVTIFNEDTPEKLLSLIKPTVHVKGGDYSDKELPERKVVEAGGGKIAFLKFIEGQSTTQMLEKIKAK